MDTYEYVMFGRIFKYEDTPSGASNQVHLCTASPHDHPKHDTGPDLSPGLAQK